MFLVSLVKTKHAPTFALREESLSGLSREGGLLGDDQLEDGEHFQT